MLHHHARCRSLHHLFLPLFAAACIAEAAFSETPISLHPENPHYLLFRGKPSVLITSGEHYGAVLNLDFDFVPYLNELKRHGLNLTRTFSGVYCESARSFNIKGNPLAPAPDKYCAPWKRSKKPGYANGGNKFDLAAWNPAYFARLKAFLKHASKCGVVVELVLFCPFYKDEMWNLSPMNIRNNINGIGDMKRTDVYTLKNRTMLAVHDAFVEKAVRELNGFENLYYEICNEPYFGGVTEKWQQHIARAIVAAEAELPHKHLIAQNIANGSKKITDPNPRVSIFNFHYARPPKAVAVNYHLKRVIGDDETGFKGSRDVTYRREGWDFVIAGGGIYSNLDYSFTPEHEDGSAVPDAPGGGGKRLRFQLKILKEFIHSFDFINMAPRNELIKSPPPKNATVRLLADPGAAYALYVNGGTHASISISMPSGTYTCEWISPVSGKTVKKRTIKHAGGACALNSPKYSEDIAVRLLRTNK